MAELELTEAEMRAKNYMICLLKEASHKPCTIGNEQDHATLPKWFDLNQYKRGQQYFHNNRFGIMGTNLLGLLTLLSEPRGLKVLSATGRSNAPETARRRYVSTILHIVSWYEFDLSPGSQSWQSLNYVRRMHLNASKNSQSKKIGIISQSDLAFTTFGFMGFAILRPHLQGIRHDCEADREAFIHFWAVMGHMLGIEDQYNMCLNPIESVTIICQMFLRYLFMPLIQLESPEFRHMVEVLFTGLSSFLPNMSYELQMFCVKRMIGIPGYQYKINPDKERTCRRLLSPIELLGIRKSYCTDHSYMEMLFGNGIPLLEKKKVNTDVKLDRNSNEINANMDTDLQAPIHKLMGLSSPDELRVTIANPDDNWSNLLNDSKFYELSWRDRLQFRVRCIVVKSYEYRLGRYIIEAGLNVVLFFMKRFQHKISKKKLSLQTRMTIGS